MQGLYIHIPFCEKLCSYCDFPKRVNMQEDYINSYLEKVISDLKKVFNNTMFDTVYIGGGTPNFLNDELLERLLKAITIGNKKTIIEFSIEGNYNHITKSQIALFKKYGVNRVSLGVQTIEKKVGKLINRYPDKELLFNSVKLLKEAGINNINLDFMFGLPMQTLNSVKKDLALIKKLDVPHISYYSLILEEKSVLFHQVKQNKIKILSENLVADMYNLVIKKLTSFGYHHYEISNFSRPGFESKHNLLYWSMDNYYGIGMSASSLIGNIRITESKIIAEYHANRGIIKEELSKEELMSEFLWLGLRKLDGISIKAFMKRFTVDPFTIYDINGLIKKGLLTFDGDILKLTRFGLEHGNYVFSAFVL